MVLLFLCNMVKLYFINKTTDFAQCNQIVFCELSLNVMPGFYNANACTTE